MVRAIFGLGLAMAQDGLGGRMAGVTFTGERTEMFGLMLRSYLLMLPTLGVYRFWLTTLKRRFYWGHTEIDGDPLEYTGQAVQLLVGFLYALLIFTPIYGLLFYLSIQTAEIGVYVYLGIGALFWFLVGYALYRGRDFRLSRTLWRGIRFDQKGSAWNYAIRRFLWSIAMVLTLGLVYPLMAADLWRYRYANTWYGDRQCRFSGRARQLAGPYYLIYFLVVGLLVLIGVYAARNHAFSVDDAALIPHGDVSAMLAGSALFGWLGMYYYQAKEISRMLSSVSCGGASLIVSIRGRSLFAQFFMLGLMVTVVGLAYIVFASAVIGTLALQFRNDMAEIVALLRQGLWPIVGLVLGYLFITGTYSLIAELTTKVSYWKLIARHAWIANIDSLADVRAAAEDPSLAGEGLADALNVGAY